MPLKLLFDTNTLNKKKRELLINKRLLKNIGFKFLAHFRSASKNSRFQGPTESPFFPLLFKIAIIVSVSNVTEINTLFVLSGSCACRNLLLLP
jgi:hypothetical protein